MPDTADPAATEPHEHEPVVDAEVVPEHEAHEPAPAGQALELHRPQGTTQLIPAANAAERVAAATEVATQLDAVIRQQGMRTKVGSQKKLDPATGEAVMEGGREVWVPRWHVNVEGWQTLATLLGLAVVPQQPTPVLDPITNRPEKVSFEVHERTYHSKAQGGGLKAERRYTVEGYSWRCRCEVFKDGVLIGAGESVCSRTEQRWKEADDYAVMGMAQTRATSRAIAAAARWIVTLAGYSATPAEEIPHGEKPQDAPPAPAALPAWAAPLDGAGQLKLVEAARAIAGDQDTATRIRDGLATYCGHVPALALMLLRPLAARLAAAEAPAQGDSTPGGSDAATGPDWQASQEAELERQAQMVEPEAAPATGPPAPAPGSVPLPEIPDSTILPEALKILRAAGCTCPSPITADPRQRSSGCPLEGHGIAF